MLFAKKSAMNLMELKILLKKANLSKKEFAQMVGISHQSVNNWGSSKNVPYWVKSYLENYIRLQKYEALREQIKELESFKNLDL